MCKKRDLQPTWDGPRPEVAANARELFSIYTGAALLGGSIPFFKSRKPSGKS